MRFEGQSAALGRFASVSLWRFNGKGRMTAPETFNSEKTGPSTRRIAGRYTVRRNCEFRLHLASTLVRGHEADGVCILQGTVGAPPAAGRSDPR